MVFSSLVTIIPSADGVQFLPLNTERELIRHLTKYATYSLGKCLLLCKVSQTSVEEEFRDILEFLLKGINYACIEDWA